MPKAHLGLSVLLCVLVFVVSGCTPASPTSHNTLHLRLSTWGSPEEMQLLRQRVQKFEAAHPTIEVEVLHIPDNYFQKLHILIAADLTPDVMFINSLNYPVYAEHGVFQDLGPFLDRPKSPVHRKDFFPQALQAFQQTGPAVGALPRDISNLVMFYNKSWFQAQGVALPTSHWTWNECLQAAKQLTGSNPSGKNTPPPQPTWGLAFFRKPPLYWLPLVWSWGGDWASKDFQRFRLQEAPAQQALTFYSDLRNKHHVAPTQAESGQATMSQLFLQQRVAMMVGGRWSVPVFRSQHNFDWDVAPLPQGPKGSHVGIDASGYAMASTTQYPEASWKLIAFLSSQESQQAFTQGGLIVPARQDVAHSKLFLDPTHPPRHSQVFLEVIAQGVPTHTPPRWNEVAETMQLALDPVWDGTQTVDQALDTLTTQIPPLLKEGRRP